MPEELSKLLSELDDVLKVVSTTSDKLDSIDIVYGQLIFSRDNRAIYFDTEEEAQFFFDNYLTPEDKEIAIIVHWILFHDGGYVNWKEYQKELEEE